MEIEQVNPSESVLINRPVYKQKNFNDKYLFKRKTYKNNVDNEIKNFLKDYHPKHILNLFTIFNLISEYNFKKYIVGDLISGLTVGILHVPTGLAYGAITSLNPIHGLYSTCFPGFVYMIFSTSKHLSVGTFAIITIMILSTINRIESNYTANLKPDLNGTLRGLSDEQIHSIRLDISTGMCFWSGAFMIALSFFKFGTVSKYLSQPLLRGFTTAASFHILVSQLTNIFGIYVEKGMRIKFFKFFVPLIEVIGNIKSTNWVALAIFLIGVVFLIVVKLYINEKYKKTLRNLQIPGELLVIIFGVLVAYYGNLNKNYKLAIVGKIPTGFPEPSMPGITYIFDVLTDTLVITFVTFATSISIADLYARKHKYKINSNQEIFSLGISNLVCSFLKCFTASGTLARTAVQSESGGHTQIATGIANLVVLLTMYYISPLLEHLPKACLAAIIISALIQLLAQITDIKRYWDLDKLDFSVWMVTFCSSIILDIDYGLLIGIFAVLFLNTYRNQSIELIELGKIKNYEIYSNNKKYSTNTFENIRIFRLSQSLSYLNADSFREQLDNFYPLFEKPKRLMCCVGKKENSSMTSADKLSNQVVILDFTLVQYVDEIGFIILKETIKQYEENNTKILISNCDDKVVSLLSKMKHRIDDLYLSIEDALKSLAIKSEPIFD